MTKSVFVPRLLRVLNWGLLFDERMGLTTTPRSWGSLNVASNYKTPFIYLQTLALPLGKLLS
jgi:hypothetical protein